MIQIKLALQVVSLLLVLWQLYSWMVVLILGNTNRDITAYAWYQLACITSIAAMLQWIAMTL